MAFANERISQEDVTKYEMEAIISAFEAIRNFKKGSKE